MGDTAYQIDALWAGLNDPDTGQSYSGAIVAFFYPGTTTPRAVWLDKDKTLPTTAGMTQTTLDSNGSARVYADGVYKINVYDPDDTGLISPLSGSIDGATYGTSVSGQADTIADLRLVEGSADQIIYIKGHTSINDGGQGYFYWNASSATADNNGTVILPTGHVGAGRWVRQYEYLTPDMFGALGNGGSGTDSLQAFQDMADAAVDGAKFVIPPKTYYIEGNVEFDIYNYTIEMYGATIVQKGTNDKTFVLNVNAVAGETDISTNVTVRGGYLINNSLFGANTNTGIDTRGTFHCNIKDIRFIDFGASAILIGSRDSIWINECSFYNNNIHIYKDEWVTVAGNPQLIYINNCVTTVFGTAGILSEGCTNEFNIKNTSFIGSDSIVFHTGSAAAASLSATIDTCSFEQGTAGGYYIRTQLEDAKTFRNLNILNNTFQDSTPHAIQLEAVNQCIIQGNKFNSNVDGVIDIDANSSNIVLGPNEFANFLSFTQGISYACARSEIKVVPSEFIVPAVSNLTGWAANDISTSTGTIDMSAVIGTYWNAAGKLIPPRAWMLQVRARDSGSAASTPKFLLRDVVGTSSADAQGIYLQGVTNDVYRTQTVIVPCDPNGDIFYDATASGATTLEVRITLLGYIK